MKSWETKLAVEDFLYREAYFLDTEQWDAWLGLMMEEVSYWMPAWTSEDQLANDPETELSLIYCEDRETLADRVFRIQTEDSFASWPLPRRCHVIGNVLVLGEDETGLNVTASWTVHQYLAQKGPRTHGGRYEYRLVRDEDTFKIAEKKIIFLNDAVDIPIDIYNV